MKDFSGASTFHILRSRYFQVSSVEKERFSEENSAVRPPVSVGIR